MDILATGPIEDRSMGGGRLWGVNAIFFYSASNLRKKKKKKKGRRKKRRKGGKKGNEEKLATHSALCNIQILCFLFFCFFLFYSYELTLITYASTYFVLLELAYNIFYHFLSFHWLTSTILQKFWVGGPSNICTCVCVYMRIYACVHMCTYVYMCVCVRVSHQRLITACLGLRQLKVLHERREIISTIF